MTRKRKPMNQIQILMEMKDSISHIDKKLDKYITMAKQTNELCIKHEKVLYGKPEDMGKTGLVSRTEQQEGKIKGIAKSIDNTRSTFVLIWTGIFAVIQGVIAGISHFLSGK